MPPAPAAVAKFAHTTVRELCENKLCACQGRGFIETKDDVRCHVWEACACLGKQHEITEPTASCNLHLSLCFRKHALLFMGGNRSEVNIDFVKRKCEWAGCACGQEGCIVSCNSSFVGHFWDGCACESKLHTSHAGTDSCLKGVQTCGSKKRSAGDEAHQTVSPAGAAATPPPHTCTNASTSTTTSPALHPVAVPAPLRVPALSLDAPPPPPAPAPTPSSRDEVLSTLIMRVPVSVRGVYGETLRATVHANRLRRRYTSLPADIVDTWGADVLRACVADADANRAAFFAAQMDAGRIVREEP